jgi:aminoglycoside/choline kinase family phosphotransferase
LVAGPLEIAVLAYRPVRRAVVRVCGREGREVYVKVVRPSEVARIVAAHVSLREAGLPVPSVLRFDPDSGVLVLSALPGDGLRARLLGSTTGWPAAAGYASLLDDLTQVPVGDGPLGDVAATVSSHALAVAAIIPTERARLDRIVEAVATVRPTATAEAVTIHGDLYEAQLMVDGNRISGLLDLDDVGPGHPLDDIATLLGHLHILQPSTRRHRDHLARYGASLRAKLASPADLPELDLRTAAVLVGLATGPFRAQTDAWRREVRRRVGMAARLVAPSREKTLSLAS